MKKTPLILLAVVLLAALGAGVFFGLGFYEKAGFATTENNAALASLCATYQAGKGTFTLGEDSRIFAVAYTGQSGQAGAKSTEGTALDAATVHAASFMAGQLAAAGYGELPVVYGAREDARPGDLVVQTEDMPAEQYTITVTRRNLVLCAGDEIGLRNGLYQLIRFFRANGGPFMGGCTLTCAPEAGERGVMIDCGRKYFTPEYMKNLIRQMAFMGYNTLELHFSDDQGTRIDIWDEEYFHDNRNGNDFSWLAGGYVGSWIKTAYQKYPDKDKYWTAAELDDIMKTAAEYRIQVIPSMDSPGHCQYLCREYANNFTLSSEFYYDGKTYSFSGIYENGTFTSYMDLWRENPNTKFNEIFAGNHITLDVTNPYGRAFILAVIEDYARFFRQYGCTVFHIGGDEVRLHTNGYGSVNWEDYVQEGYSKYDTCVDYLNEETAMLKELGYEVRAFSDFVDYVSEEEDYAQHIQLDGDVQLSYWIGDYDLETARPVSHFLGQRKLLNCLQNYCYYSLTESAEGKDGRDPDTRDWDFYYSTEDRIYNHWNPTVFTWEEKPGKGTVADPAQVAGGYFLIWCDNAAMSTEEQMWKGVDETGKYNFIDRMWSNITKMWVYDANERLSYEDFAALRECFGYFPGYVDCSQSPALPVVPKPVPAE